MPRATRPRGPPACASWPGGTVPPVRVFRKVSPAASDVDVLAVGGDAVGGVGVHAVEAGAAGDGVEAATHGVEPVVAGAAVEGIVVQASGEDVIAVLAEDDVLAALALEAVVALVAE